MYDVDITSLSQKSIEQHSSNNMFQNYMQEQRAHICNHNQNAINM